MKKICTLLLSFVLTLVSSFAGFGIEIGENYIDEELGLRFRRNLTNSITVITVLDQNRNAYVIPDNIDGIPVYSISEGVFQDCALESISFSSALIEIGRYAFLDCAKLKSIDLTVAGMMHSVGHNAFQNCIALEEAKLGGRIETINDYTFDGCVSLTNVTMPKTVKQIGTSAFRNCTSLEKITIPPNVSTLYQNSFEGIDDLELTVLHYGYEDTTVDGTDKPLITDNWIADPFVNHTIIHKMAQLDSLSLSEDGVAAWEYPAHPAQFFHLQLNTVSGDGSLTPVGEPVSVNANQTSTRSYDFSDLIKENGGNRYAVTGYVSLDRYGYQDSDVLQSNIQEYNAPTTLSVIFLEDPYRNETSAHIGVYSKIDATVYYTVVPKGQYTLENPPEIDTTKNGITILPIDDFSSQRVTFTGFPTKDEVEVYAVARSKIGLLGPVCRISVQAYEETPGFQTHSVTKTDTGYTYSFTTSLRQRAWGKVILAMYQDGVLVGMHIHDFNTDANYLHAHKVENAVANIAFNADSYRLFFWSDLSKFVPVCDSAQGIIG